MKHVSRPPGRHTNTHHLPASRVKTPYTRYLPPSLLEIPPHALPLKLPPLNLVHVYIIYWQGLVAAAAAAARDNGIEFAGENALWCWTSESAIEQVLDHV